MGFGKLAPGSSSRKCLRGIILLIIIILPVINYLLAESEVITGKSQSEVCMRFSRRDRTFEVMKLFIIWFFVLFS